MAYPPTSSDTYTDLTTYYYKTNCSDVLNSIDKNIRCNTKLGVEECCKYIIHNIYHTSYDLNKCYYINDTFVEFKCNEERAKDFLMSLLIAFIMAFCMCFCILIYEMNKLGFFNCKKERNFNHHLLVNNNPVYGT